MRGARRLDDPDDFVRMEIEHALAADVAIVPVLGWVLVAWDAYRQAFGCGRVRVLLAAVIWFALLAAWLALVDGLA